LQRQGELGLWLSCRGQEAAQIGSVSALRASDHIFPAYREHAVGLYRASRRASCWPRGVAARIAAGTRRGTGCTSTASCSLPRRCTRPATRWASRPTAPTRLFSRTSATAPLARATRRGAQLGGGEPGARRLLLPEQPVGHLDAGRGAVPHAAAPARGGFGLRAAYVDGNDALAVHAVTADAVAAVRAGAVRVHRGDDLPDGRAQHLRRPARYRDDAEVDQWQAAIRSRASPPCSLTRAGPTRSPRRA